MPAKFNPFARSTMKIVEPLIHVGTAFNGWSGEYEVEYRASRGAANVGLLQNQFAAGKTLVVQGKHLVVLSADFTVTNGAANEVTVRVRAQDFERILAASRGQSVTSAPIGTAYSIVEDRIYRGPEPRPPVIQHNFNQPGRRRILK